MTHENDNVDQVSVVTEPEPAVEPAAKPTGFGAWLWSEKTFNLGVITAGLLIMAIPVGLATIWLGFIQGESPCTLCGYERFGMVLIAVLAIFIVRYGPRRKYMFMLVIASAFFLYTTVRHWSIHWQHDTGQGLAEAMFGAHTYTWGVFVYWVVIAAAGLGVFWVGKSTKLADEFAERSKPVKKLSTYSFVSGIVILALTAANSLQFFLLTGPPPFAGTGQPARFTLDIGQASKYWSTGLWTRILNPKIHPFTPPMVHIPGIHTVGSLADKTNPADGPITELAGKLEVQDRIELGFNATGQDGAGQAGGIAYDESTGLFAIVSTRAAVYYVEDDFSTVVASAVLDVVNGYNATHTTDATFFGPDALVATAWNKTLWGTDRVDPSEVDAKVEWKEYRETTGNLMPHFGSKNRPLLNTARAKGSYTLSIAMNHDTGLYALVNIPSPTAKKMVVSQFASDNYLAREDVLTFADSLAVAPEATVNDYYPVGADIADGKMYLLSKTYQTLLIVDMETIQITEAWELPEIGDYHGIAVAGDSLWILSDDDGKDVVFKLNRP